MCSWGGCPASLLRPLSRQEPLFCFPWLPHSLLLPGERLFLLSLPLLAAASRCLAPGALCLQSAHRSSGRLSARSPHVPGDFGASSACWMWLLCGTIMAAWGESLEQAGRQGDAVPGGNPWLFLTLFSFCLLCAPLQMVITSQSPSVWAAGPRGAGWEAPFSCCKGLLGKQEPRRG